MILVTGGTGLVGAHLLYQLTLENSVVKAIYRKSSNLQAVKDVFSYYSDNYEKLFQKIKWVEADILDIFSLEEAFKQVTEVYHAAALISFNPKEYYLMRKINIEGTANIVNFCIENKIKKLCYVSSIATIGKSTNNNVIDETNEWDIEKSNYGYAITKYGAEMEVWRASQEGVPVVIVNPGVILGAGFWNRGSGQLFSRIKNGMKFYSEGVTGYVAVTDVVKIMKQLMDSTIKNERFILVAENVSFKTVFTQIAQNLNVKQPTIKISKLMSEIGWRLDFLKSFFTGKPPILTKHTAKTIHQKRTFSSNKIKETLHYNFEPINDTIKNVCDLYNK